MSNVLLLVHRLPYPPNKGDKVRSYHLLKHLLEQHRVFLGTFVDDPDDERHVETVRNMCVDTHVEKIAPGIARLRSLTGLLQQQALSVRYYQSAGMQAWVKKTLVEQKIDVAVVFSSVMAQFLDESKGGPAASPMVVDFVDMDSFKWTQYAGQHAWPLSWLYRREGERLLGYERGVAARARRAFFVTENEASLFKQHAPECAPLVQALSNGVDSDYFAPDPERPSPFTQAGARPDGIPLVFTGAMDYWPNIDAVTWFVRDVFPALRADWPGLRFFIVGRSPTPAVLALACASVVVTGTVPDVRPYLQHAAVVVAPLRVARGLQNKILEAMSMARPVVASQSCADALDARVGDELLAATTSADFVREIDGLLRMPARADALARAARPRVVSSYSWGAHMQGFDSYLNANPAAVTTL
jgi:sugar transferase (PEP-CTERM/EpsH1 system associated)